MTQENKPLQRRAGLNIGVEPDVGQFLQDSGAKEKTLSLVIGAENVILECPERTARTPIPMGGEAEGMIFNTLPVAPANLYTYMTFFRDEDGNECPLFDALTPPSVAGGAVAPFAVHDGRLQSTGFTLTPGQKIILRRLVNPAPPVP